MMTTFDMLDKGDYASILPGCLCLSSLDDPKMMLTPLLKPTLQVDYLLIEPSSKATPTVVTAFADVLCQHILKWCTFGRETFQTD